ncbi:hypothetical protein [Bacteroides sp. 519]|uniref:hypothetical protein n=1 Tax=Bacteroides sp. 519 TaxID=2302937 RepID=UPI0013D7E053|nr:hypothetical protein [Bacteroides sp. 519]NDV57673.1 hypothetical protein [Bacteroides sp. 519]
MDDSFIDLFYDLIADPIGVYTRYFFFKLIRKEKNLEYLRGNSVDPSNNLSHTTINFIVGIAVLCSIILGIAYLLFILGLL